MARPKKGAAVTTNDGKKMLNGLNYHAVAVPLVTVALSADLLVIFIYLVPGEASEGWRDRLMGKQDIFGG